MFYALYFGEATTPHATRIVVARSVVARLWGLLGRRSLTADEGMLFVRARAMHTWGMRTAIDVLWLRTTSDAATFDIVRSDGTVGPGDSRKCENADTLLELAPGSVARIGVLPTRLRLEPLTQP